ncbi:MAG: DUF1905 domain-containing protein [Gemmatimonadetes bacterium]|nr:DUF1905 domain-containing protein [Gemmatimonadota bacterium]MCC6773292.1 DUF1905 domain-containing protein [Gemmatimonadaceae bacterium]
MSFTFTGRIWEWRGPSPFHFVTVPAKQCRDLQGIAKLVTYGWGMVPVVVRIGGTEWKTSLFPRDGRYLIPLKDSVRRAEGLAVGERVTVGIEVR